MKEATRQTAASKRHEQTGGRMNACTCENPPSGRMDSAMAGITHPNAPERATRLPDRCASDSTVKSSCGHRQSGQKGARTVLVKTIRRVYWRGGNGMEVVSCEAAVEPRSAQVNSKSFANRAIGGKEAANA